MRLHLLRGNFAAAKKLLAETREGFLTNPQYEITPQNSVIYNLTMDMCEGYLYGCLNSPDLIPEWLRSGEIEAKPLMMRGAAFPFIVYGKAVLLSQNWAELEALCEGAEKHYLVYRNQLGLLHNAISAAVAKYHLYGMDAGIKTLLPALKEAQKDGVLLPFAENAAFILPMLNEIREADVLDPAYMERLIRLGEQYSQNLATRSPVIRLTDREAQVMELISQGLTNRQIADQLYLSVASVKKHLESIYAKLEVNNKVSAVQKAQKEGFLRKN
jgi:LuxR family maltose regulon positive regulatory protein